MLLYNDIINATNSENEDRLTNGFVVGGCRPNGEGYQTDC
jgi:hypothetical protein